MWHRHTAHEEGTKGGEHMTRYEFYNGEILELSNGERTVFIDLATLELFEDADDVRYLFEKYGMGEKNPLLSDEDKRKLYGCT
jgi:hypothetical protein